MHILLVEDNVMVAKGLIYSLEQQKYEITHTLNFNNTKLYLENNSVDLIILDISLPDGNGFTLYEKYIKDKAIPTIFLTARDDEDDIVKGLELGAEDYITKPFSTKELIARINKIMARNKQNLIIKVKNIEFDIDKMAVYKDK